MVSTPPKTVMEVAMVLNPQHPAVTATLVVTADPLSLVEVDMVKPHRASGVDTAEVPLRFILLTSPK